MPLEHRIREAIDTFMARVRHDLDAHVRGLTSDLLRLVQEDQDRWRTEIDRSVDDVRVTAERDFRARVDNMRGELAREMELRLSTDRTDLQTAVAAAKSGMRDVRVDTLARLLGSIRQIDQSSTLSGILEALARGAAAETSRVAIMLIDGDMLRSWGHFGFATGETPHDMPIGQSGVLAAAVALKQTSFVPPGGGGREAAVPSFMRVAVGHTGLVVPIPVGGEVVAVLYADDVGRREEQEDAPVWTEEVDLLVRHAALRLENVTSIRTVEVLEQ